MVKTIIIASYLMMKGFVIIKITKPISELYISVLRSNDRVMMAKRKVVASILLAGVLLIGCGKETNTYSEGLQEGFKTGYSEALFQYDKIAADSGKIVVYADKYGYLMGYHDGLAGNDHISEDEYETKFGYESFIIGYDQGYEDALEGNDSLEDFGGALTWHNVSIHEGEIEGNN